MTRWRKAVFALAALTLLGFLAAGTLMGGVLYDKALRWRSDVTEIRREVEMLRREMAWLRNATRLGEEAIHQTPPEGSDFIFVAHVYWANGYREPALEGRYAKLRDPSQAMTTFIKVTNQIEPLRVVFGGDTVWSPTVEALQYVRDTLVPRFTSSTRFILGNHDDRGDVTTSATLFTSIFPQPYYYEDVAGIRLIYLTTSSSEGLGKDQLDFLREALLDETYTAALVFVHHALWLEGEKGYANVEYEDVGGEDFAWSEDVLPLLLGERRVAGVFAGDGGMVQPTMVTDICGLPHYLTGWANDVEESPPEFLHIVVNNTGEASVLRKVMFDGKVYVVPEKWAALSTPPECR